jgi:hypothetical protein
MYGSRQKRDGLAAACCLVFRSLRIPTCGATIMGSTWKKAVVLLASCGALGACGSSGDQAVSARPQIAQPATARAQGAAVDPAKYDPLTIAQPADRVIDL